MLNINSIFLSVMGECNPWGQGAWAVFVRTQGCSANCHYCDTKYAQSHSVSNRIPNSRIIKEIEYQGYGCKRVLITGGEPLEQERDCLKTLIQNLISRGMEVCVETNGLRTTQPLWANISPPRVGKRLSFIYDYKLDKHIFPNKYRDLCRNDYLKFVIENEHKFNQAIEIVGEIKKTECGANIYFSPCLPMMRPERLFKLMKKHECQKYEIGFNLQMHKYIFPEDSREEEK